MAYYDFHNLAKKLETELKTVPKIGQTLKPKPLWNSTAHHLNKLAEKVSVYGVMVSESQTGIMVLVENNSKRRIWLDLGWFDGDS